MLTRRHLAAVQPVPEHLSTYLSAADQLREHAASSETLRAYKADWARFELWCRDHGAEPLPASPGTLAAYTCQTGHSSPAWRAWCRTSVGRRSLSHPRRSCAASSTCTPPVDLPAAPCATPIPPSRDRRAHLAPGEGEPGYLRIVGELKKLGLTISKGSVANVLLPRAASPRPATPRPATGTTTGRAKLGGVLRAQAKGILATDFFAVESVLLQRHYVPFVLKVERRVVHLLCVRANPDEAWVTQVARNLVGDVEETGRTFRFLVRDRDANFTTSFDGLLASIGIAVIKTPARSRVTPSPSASSEPSETTAWTVLATGSTSLAGRQRPRIGGADLCLRLEPARHCHWEGGLTPSVRSEEAKTPAA
jgi:hypothetical protein